MPPLAPTPYYPTPTPLLASASPLPRPLLTASAPPATPTAPIVLGQPSLAIHSPLPLLASSAPPPIDWQAFQNSLDAFNKTVANLSQASPPPTSATYNEAPLPNPPVNTGDDETPLAPSKHKQAKPLAKHQPHHLNRHTTPDAEDAARKLADSVEQGVALYLSQDPNRIDEVEALADRLTPDMLDPNTLAQKMHRWFKQHKLLQVAEFSTRIPVNILLNVLPPASKTPDEPSPLLNRQRVKTWRDAIVSGKSL